MLKKVYHFPIILFIVISGCIFNENGKRNGSAKVKFKNDTIDFGIIRRNDTAFAVFELTNINHDPLIVKNVKADCGCTKIYYPKDTLYANDSKIIKIVYDNKSTSDSGLIQKTILVQTNSYPSLHILVFKGIVH